MFSFSGAKVRRFSFMCQIYRHEKTKNSPFVDINQNFPDLKQEIFKN